MITSETHHFEIQYKCNDATYTTVIDTGIIDDTGIVIKYLKQEYNIELIYIRKLNY